MITLLVSAFLVAALVGYGVSIYNGLVRVGASVKLAWSNIDVLLVQRHDELPKLVEVCRQYMEYERDTLERVTKARNAVDAARSSGHVNSVGASEQELRAGQGKVPQSRPTERRPRSLARRQAGRSISSHRESAATA